MSTATGTVYVVVHTKWLSGDVGGSLLLDTGEVLFDHLSSGVEWLTRDLTCGFADRRGELERRYPNGYKVVVICGDDDIPADVVARNAEWQEATT